MRKKLIILLAVMLVMSSFAVISANNPKPLAGPNYMGFTEPIKHVTVGDTFYSYIYCDINSKIDTIAVSNLTYLPAGILNYNQLTNSESKGNIFDDDYTVVYSRATHINDSIGQAYTWVWGIDAPGSTPCVNNTNATAFNVRWDAVGCGIATVTILDVGNSGTACEGIDPGTDIYDGTVYVHPESTGSFNAVATNTTNIHLTWAKFTGDDRVVIRYNTGAGPAPTNPESGTLLYNNTGTSTDHSGLTPGDHIWYSAWGYNDTGLYSISFQSDNEILPYPNYPPTFGTPSPINGSIDQSIISVAWSIPINDPEGDTFDWDIECSNGQSNGAAGATNGTKSLSISNLEFDTTYTVWVNATDELLAETNEWFVFTTVVLEAPTIFTATADGRFAIDLSWTNNDYADSTLVRAKLGGYPANVADGLLICNTSGTSWSFTTLDPATHWFFSAWSWNETNGEYSAVAHDDATTDANNIPAVTSVYPPDTTTDVSISYSNANVTIADDDGDRMALNIKMGKAWATATQVYYGTNLINGTRTFSPYGLLGELDYNTTYYIYTNLTDSYDWKNESFWFKTGAEEIAMIDLVYLNSTGTGYNFIAALNSTADISEIGQRLIDENISWEYITYWDSDEQTYSSDKLINNNGVMYGSDFTGTSGDVILIAMLENLSFEYYGFSPTMPWEDIAIDEGFVWLGRTVGNTSAYYLGENLTHFSANWSMIFYYNQYIQEWSNEILLPGDPLGDPSDFDISPGMAVMVNTNATGTFRMGGW